MMFSNAGGIITQGFGPDSRIITKGYVGSPDFRGPVQKEELGYLKYGLTAPLFIPEEMNRKITSPLTAIEGFDAKIIQPLISEDLVKGNLTIPLNNKRLKIIKKILELI